MISVAELGRVGILKDFPPETLTAIVSRLTERTFAAGAPIIFRGDPGFSMFMILKGSIAATLINDEGIEYTLSTLSDGEVFGEIALMTGEPRSANVKAVTEVHLAELSQEVFLELVAAFPKLNESLLQLAAQRRTRSTVREQFAGLEREELIAKLFAQKPPEIDAFLGKTKWTADTNAAITGLAGSRDNVLILGERGTGKALAARLIANPPPIRRDVPRGKDGEQDALHLELAQEDALFGHGANAASYAKSVRRGYLGLADGGTVLLENIDALAPSVQLLLARCRREGSFLPKGASQSISSRVRLIATTCKTAQEPSREPGIDPELLALLGSQTLQLKPLRERKKDIPVLAQHFLEEYKRKFSKEIDSFSKESLNLLVDHDWPLNVDEMRQVVERAVVISRGNTISESQVFLNVPSFSATGKFNLLKIPQVRQILSHRLFPLGLRFVTVPFILLLILGTLLGPQEHNPANVVVWGVWWPTLVLSVVISARAWCGYCPMPVLSDGINSLRRKPRPVPDLLARYGVWIGMVGFAAILLAEHASHMFTDAHATSVLLLSILSGATVTNFFFGRRSWCKHICPLGRMVGYCSSLSIMELATNSNVCSSQCQTHDCVKEKSCPMGLHPSAAAASKDCVMCLSCLKSCKHQSVRIDARLPWHELNNREKWDLITATFAVSLTGLVLAVKLPSWGPLARLYEQLQPGHTFLTEVVVPVAVWLLFAATAWLASSFGAERRWKSNFAVSGPAYLFLAFSGFFNIYFHEFVHNGPNLLPWLLDLLKLAGTIPYSWVTPELGTLKALVPLVTLAGAAASLVMLGRLAKRHGIPNSVLRAHRCIVLATTLAFLVLL